MLLPMCHIIILKLYGKRFFARLFILAEKNLIQLDILHNIKYLTVGNTVCINRQPV